MEVTHHEYDRAHHQEVLTTPSAFWVLLHRTGILRCNTATSLVSQIMRGEPTYYRTILRQDQSKCVDVPGHTNISQKT